MTRGARVVACMALATGVACTRDAPPVDVAAEAGTGGGPSDTSARLPASEGAPAGSGSPAAGAWLGPASAGSTSPPTSSTAASSPGSSTRLLDAGQPPRRTLRYQWHIDRKEQLAMDLRTSAVTEVAGSKQPEIALPPVHVLIDIDPGSVSPDGDLRYAWRVSAATVTSQTPSPIADGMRAEVNAIDGLAGSAVVSSRGLCTEVAVAAAPSVDAGATGQMVEQVRQTLRDVAPPMPEEAIGRGARWQKISQLDAKASHLTQTDTFTLVASTPGDTGTVDDILAQTAPPQLLRAPGVVNGAEAHMESMLASGDGKTRFDLSRLVPQTQFAGMTTMIVSGRSREDATQRVTMVMRVGLDIQGLSR
jgi:hypothetical protein